MAAVVNHLHFTEPVDPAIFARFEHDLVSQARAIEGFRSFHVVQTSQHDVIFVIFGDSIEVLDQLATQVGSRWMREDLVPLLDGPPQRHIGPIIASSEHREAGSSLLIGTPTSDREAVAQEGVAST